MISLWSALSGGLVWSKTPHKRGYELRRDEGIVGSLQRKSFWSSEFQAESAHGRWKFRRTGCFRTGTEILDSNSGARIAILKSSWTGGGRLEFSDGTKFRFTCKGIWRPVWRVLTDTGQPVLSIHSREKRVELPSELHLSEDRLILLAIFAWHIMKQAEEDAASVSAAVAVTS